MQASSFAYSAGSSIRSNPVGVFKILAFIVAALLFLYIAFKGFKLLSYLTETISDLGPTSESSKQETISDPIYQDGMGWLEPLTGLTAIAKAKYKTGSAYQDKKGISDALLNKTAGQIWDAKFPFYIDSTEVQSAIAALPSKAAISLMAGRFDYLYKNKTGFYPLKTFLTKYLKVSEMDTLTKIISKKPDL